MALKTVVVFDDPDKVGKIKIDDREIVHTLGRKEDAIAVQLKELFEAVVDSASEVVNTEAQLTVEITGSLDVKISGGLQYLVFNIGSEATKGKTAKVSLTTKLQPSESSPTKKNNQS